MCDDGRMTTALITGASSGIGKATALAFLDAGIRVYAAARRVDKMRDLEAQGATVLAMDITRDADIQAVVSQIDTETGGVDVLVNNAGFGMYGAMEDTSIDDARYQFEVNLFGLARLTQLLLPAMRARRSGRIINVSSMGGRIYTPLGSWYHATKHALEGWSDCLRLELASFGIDVVIVQPGLVGSDFGDAMVDPMLERSGNTAYAAMARSVAGTTRETYGKPGGASPPSLIATTILRAATARRPKTRYAVGKLARPLLWARKWLGDRLFDRAMLTQVDTSQ